MASELQEIANDPDDLVSFDRERHEYRRGRIVYPAVTQALRSAGLVRFFCNKAVLEASSRRGKAVHWLTADDDRNRLNYTVEAALSGFVEGWRLFKKEYRFKPHLVEHRLFNETHQYAGTLDVTGWMFHGSSQQRYVLIDRKTGSPSGWHKEQVAAYHQALPLLAEIPDRKYIERYAIYLRPNGHYTLKQFSMPQDFSCFLAALTIARLRAERGLIHADDAFDEIFTGEIG